MSDSSLGHETLIQCCFNVVPQYSTLGQHQSNRRRRLVAACFYNRPTVTLIQSLIEQTAAL